MIASSHTCIAYITDLLDIMPTSAVISEAEYFCPMPRPRLKRFMLTLMLFVALELSPLRVDAGAAASVTVTLNKRGKLT